MNKTTIGNVQLTETDTTLTTHQTPKARIQSLLTMALGAYMMFGLGYAGFHIHQWWLAVLGGIFFLFGIFGLYYQIRHGGEKVVIDRELAQLLRNGKQTHPLSEISGLRVFKNSGSYQPKFVLNNGKTEPVLTIALFPQQAEAMRYAEAIAQFIDVPVNEAAPVAASQS